MEEIHKAEYGERAQRFHAHSGYATLHRPLQVHKLISSPNPNLCLFMETSL